MSALEWKWNGKEWLHGKVGDKWVASIYRSDMRYVVAGDSDRSFLSVDHAKAHAIAFAEYWAKVKTDDDQYAATEAWEQIARKSVGAMHNSEPVAPLVLSDVKEANERVEELRAWYDANPGDKRAVRQAIEENAHRTTRP